MSILRALVVASYAVGLSATATAAVTFFGPTPYLSAADSPFAEYLDGPNFYLEDFEDGELNTPGIFQPIISPLLGTASHGVVVGPSDSTDSVDADDGLLDNAGSSGHSFRSESHILSPTLPVRNQLNIDFEFDSDELGFLPNAFGFVWTDGPAVGGFVLNVRDATTGDRVAGRIFELPTDSERDSQVIDDFFVGVISDEPFGRYDINVVFFGDYQHDFFEIDHVQYGRLPVPEPASIVLLGILLIAFRIAIHHHRTGLGPGQNVPRHTTYTENA